MDGHLLSMILASTSAVGGVLSDQARVIILCSPAGVRSCRSCHLIITIADGLQVVPGQALKPNSCGWFESSGYGASLFMKVMLVVGRIGVSMIRVAAQCVTIVIDSSSNLVRVHHLVFLVKFARNLSLILLIELKLWVSIAVLNNRSL